MSPAERDRYVPITVPLGADVIDWVTGRIRDGDWRAVERLGAVVGARLVQEALDAARDVARDRDRDGARETDPGDDDGGDEAAE